MLGVLYRPFSNTRPATARAMALAALHEDEQRIICTQLCSTLEPRLAVYFSSASRELRELTQALLQQLRADHKMAAALCVKLGLRCCKELREARRVVSVQHTGLSTADLALLGTLGSVLPALETLSLSIPFVINCCECLSVFFCNAGQTSQLRHLVPTRRRFVGGEPVAERACLCRPRLITQPPTCVRACGVAEWRQLCLQRTWSAERS